LELFIKDQKYLIIKKKCEQIFKSKYSIFDEDIISEAMTSIILQYFKNKERINHFDSWLYAAIHFNYCSYIRKKKNDKIIILDNIIIEDIGSEMFPETKIDMPSVREIISKLDSPYKEIVELKIFGGLKHQEISERLNLKLLTVRKYYRRAIEKISKHIEFLSLFIISFYYIIKATL
jgi:RNA polymerase sigma-70 factor, ECF subfamily